MQTETLPLMCAWGGGVPELYGIGSGINPSAACLGTLQVTFLALLSLFTPPFLL